MAMSTLLLCSQQQKKAAPGYCPALNKTIIFFCFILAHLYRITSNESSSHVPFSELELDKYSSNLIHICIILENSFRFGRLLRCYPGGIYVMMLFKIFESFVKTIHIWVLAGLCFSASFKILMKENSLPWQPATNSTSSFLAMLVTFTKVSAMMTGELNADDILKENNWIANILLILFEGLTVIILTNFMVSLAVGDVNDLRDTAEERIFFAKIWHYVIVDSYYKSLSCLIPFLEKWNRKVIKNNINIVFIHKKGDYIFNVYKDEDGDFSNVIFPADDENDSTFYSFNENSVTPNVAFLINETVIERLLNKKGPEDKIRKIKRQLFGLNWSSAIKDVKKREFRFMF